MTAEPFQLTKWYLDCVAENGDTAILYSAELSWRALRLGYSSVITVIADARATDSALGQMQFSCTDHDIHVGCDKLGVEGTWHRDSTELEKTVFEGAEGTIHWRCLQPRAAVRVRIAEVHELTGLGYAECLTLTVPPWRLPLDRLRWGRFVSPEDTVTWIDWQGRHSCAFVFHNGCEAPIRTICDTQIALADSSLQLDLGLTLRSGELGDTVAPGLPILRKVLPQSLFRIDETKWRSRGLLRTPEGESSGWAIHEVVQWNV